VGHEKIFGREPETTGESFSKKTIHLPKRNLVLDGQSMNWHMPVDQ
jgi:hypothetical protein